MILILTILNDTKKSLSSNQSELLLTNILPEFKSQKKTLKKWVNNKIPGIRQETQGANISGSTELKKFKDESEIIWKSKGNRNTTQPYSRCPRNDGVYYLC